MLARIYIEALLADEVLADQVWEAWREGRYYGWSGGEGMAAHSV